MFSCKICKKTFKRKDYLIKHFNRKFPCKPTENENRRLTGKPKKDAEAYR